MTGSISASSGRLLGPADTVIADLVGVSGAITGSGEIAIIADSFDASIGGAVDVSL